ncbi:MAG: hypothetical protein JNN20_16515 [Betaproteobacteria bacterium]|nr:hypothetical protein [Betaproteobacteria bacterium]
MKQFFSRIALTAAALGSTAFAQASTFTDMWWNANESGWGMNIVQQDETAVITLYTYDANRNPVWYFASTAPVTAYTAAGLPIFIAELYRTRGPWEGGNFDPSQVAPVRVGVLSLEPRDKDRLRLSYSVDGLVVNKEVTRMSFRQHKASGIYRGAFNLRQILPDRGPYGTAETNADIDLTIEAGQAHMNTLINGVSCDFRGPYAQSGKLGSFSGNFTCSSGRSGTFTVTEMEIGAHGVTGMMTTATSQLQERGRFAAVLRF